MIGNDAGKVFSQQLVKSNIIHSGICEDDTSDLISIRLSDSASAIDGAYDPARVLIIKGTGAGQARQIFEYDGANRRAYVNRDWKVIPDETSEYVLVFDAGDSHVNEGRCMGGAASSVTLNALASSQNNIYLGQMIYIVAGTGADQARMCIGYNGTTKVATVDSPWIVQPDDASVYAIYPWPGFVFGRPTQNVVDNVLFSDVVGNKTDYVTVPYSPGVSSIMGKLNTLYLHAHGRSVLYPDKANAVSLTSGSGAWGTGGAITEVIPAGALSVSAFDLHWLNVQDISANAQLVVDLYSGGIGAEVLIGSTRAWRNAVFSAEGSKRIQVPQQPAGSRISARLSDSTAGTITVGISLEGHYYAV